jgi:hypothetical protein
MQALKHDMPILAVHALPSLDFEARKDAAQLLGAIVRLECDGNMPGAVYVRNHPELLQLLFDGCTIWHLNTHMLIQLLAASSSISRRLLCDLRCLMQPQL